MKFVVDEKQSVKLAHQLASNIKSPCKIFFQGEIGMGKTTFIRGLLKAFGVSGSIKSPTFALVEPYKLKDKAIYHFDLYRLGHSEELEYVGFRDYWHDAYLICLEWPEKAHDFLPKPDLMLKFSYREQAREVEFVHYSSLGKDLIACLTQKEI